MQKSQQSRNRREMPLPLKNTCETPELTSHLMMETSDRENKCNKQLVYIGEEFINGHCTIVTFF